MNSWTANGKVHNKCTKEERRSDEVIKPCGEFTDELRFQKEMQKKMQSPEMDEEDKETLLKLWGKHYNYFSMDINDFIDNHDAPVEIRFKVKSGGKKKDVMFHCGMTEYPTTEDKVQSNGWCATKKYRGKLFKTSKVKYHIVGYEVETVLQLKHVS